MFKSIFRTALTDVTTDCREELGALRVEHDKKYGERWFRYVQNRTGGTLAADSLVMYDGAFTGSTGTACTTNTTKTLVKRASGSWITDGVKVDDIIYCLDDAGGAGAAPEGEVSYVTEVSALTLTISPAFTAAVTASDTVDFIKRWSVIAAAALGGWRTAGIPMASLLTLTYGWIQTKGIYPTADVTAAGTAITEGARLMPGAAILEIQAAVAANADVATDVYIIAVAQALQALASDTVARKCAVLLNCI